MASIFSIISSIYEISEVQTLIKLILIVILSGIVGWERESWNKPAGFRTHVLVGISAVMVMICGEYVFKLYGADPTRIPAQLLSGIGFLGAGTILRDGFNVKGLTTAAGLLSVTCIGLLIGAGYYLGGIIATLVVYFVLSYSHKLSTKLGHTNTLDLEVSSKNPKEILGDIKDLLIEYNLEIVRLKLITDDNGTPVYIKIIVKYKEEDFDKNGLLAKIMNMEKVNEVIEV